MAASRSAASARRESGAAGAAGRALRRRGQLLDLALERTSAGVQLEEHRLGRLARVPELSALRVVGESLHA